MKRKPITSKFITDKYNLDNERHDKNYLNYDEELVNLISSRDDYNKDIPSDDFLELVRVALEDIDIVRVDNSYDGFTVELYKHDSVPETDNEVIQRLKVKERLKRQKIDDEERDRVEYERLKLLFETK